MNARAASDGKSKVERHRATLVNRLLLAMAVVGLAILILTYVTLPGEMSRTEQLRNVAPFIAGWIAILIAWRWQTADHRVRASILLLSVYAFGAAIFLRGGLSGSGRVWLLLLPALSFILLGLQSGIVAGIVSVLTYVALGLGWLSHPLPAESVTTSQTWIGEGVSFLLAVISLTVILWSYNRGWSETLEGADAATQRMQKQTRELEEANERSSQQTSLLQTAIEIARAGSSILDPDKLLDQVVNQIQNGFSPMGVYHVGLFLLDEAQRSAVLQAATGEAGRLSLEMGYRLELDDTSTIGWCITHCQARVTSNVERGAMQFGPIPMPHTRSEIALPLRSRGHILGALSVQSTQEAAFGETDVAVLQTMADQVAVAVDNARLFSQTETMLEEVQAVQRRYLGQAWQDFLATRPVSQVEYTQPGAELGDGDAIREARRQVMIQGQTVVVEPQPDAGSNGVALVVPLKLKEQVIGTMVLQETDPHRPWTDEEMAMAETIAEQAALTVDNLRLMEETQRRAGREQLTREITDKMRRANDIDDLMLTAIREMSVALGTSNAFVQLSTPFGFMEPEVTSLPQNSPIPDHTNQGELL
jgi:GAF domain-containing protein